MLNPIKVVRDYYKFSESYKRFCSRSISIGEAHDQVRIRLQQRGQNFISLVDQNVFRNPNSPYKQLFDLADCTLSDLESLIASKGLTNTLQALRQSGVYFSFEEYKCRQPVIRDGREIPLKPADFDNISTVGRMEGETGGTTGKPVSYQIDFAHIAQEGPSTLIAMEAYGVLGAPVAIWMGVLPDASGPSNLLRFAACGHLPEKWFANVVTSSRFVTRVKSNIYNRSIVDLGRRYGLDIPQPEQLPLDSADIVAEWMHKTIQTHGRCVLYGQVSKGLRVALAAHEKGIDLTGATFMLGGEPVTPAKIATIAQSGATCIPVYAFSEHGKLGMGCSNSIAEDEVHLFEDLIAVIQHPRIVEEHGLTVDSFHWTSLSAAAPKILINVESDDYGTIEERSCGCPMANCGFTKTVRNIRSFSKMTGEGVTLVGSNLVHVLEEVLPAKFGGSLLDYQLAEEEDGNGVTRVSLIIAPEIQLPEDDVVIQTFFDATTDEAANQIWAPAGTVQIKRQKPRLTGRGKLMPLQLSNAAK